MKMRKMSEFKNNARATLGFFLWGAAFNRALVLARGCDSCPHLLKTAQGWRVSNVSPSWLCIMCINAAGCMRCVFNLESLWERPEVWRDSPDNKRSLYLPCFSPAHIQDHICACSTVSGCFCSWPLELEKTTISTTSKHSTFPCCWISVSSAARHPGLLSAHFIWQSRSAKQTLCTHSEAQPQDVGVPPI